MASKNTRNRIPNKNSEKKKKKNKKKKKYSEFSKADEVRKERTDCALNDLDITGSKGVSNERLEQHDRKHYTFPRFYEGNAEHYNFVSRRHYSEHLL
tara:strand:+ start:89 stop:379 length:291 start_codon:yes stop_codon:yes gene_type:complete